MIQKIKFDIDGEAHQIVIDGPIFGPGNQLPGARMVESLLMTHDLDDFRVKLWNQGIDVIESGLIVYVASGGNIDTPAFSKMVRCQVTMLKRRLGL
jgi:hypothetical protein